MSANAGSSQPKAVGGVSNYRNRLILGFSIFFVFFIFYMGTAIIQTPNFQTVAAIPFAGMPLGLFLSLMVFPVSWVLIAIFFILWK